MKSFKIIVLVLGLVLAGTAFADWTAPSSNPPTCLAGQPGCDAPVNVGTVNQTKSGGLGILGSLIIGPSGSFTLSNAPGAGKVLTSDATGRGTWQTPTGGGYWTLVGNHISNTNVGSVGIGTANPLTKLHVQAQGNAPTVEFSDTTNPRYASGIGANLVQGVGRFLEFYAGDSGSNSSPLGINNVRMFVHPSGNVGIGLTATTPPQERLHVVGNILSSADIRASRNLISNDKICFGNDCRNSWEGGGGVGGSGTINRIPKFTAQTVIGNSSITDTGTRVDFTTPVGFPAPGGGSQLGWNGTENYLRGTNTTVDSPLMLNNALNIDSHDRQNDGPTHFNYQDAGQNFIRGTATYIDTPLYLRLEGAGATGDLLTNIGSGQATWAAPTSIISQSFGPFSHRCCGGQENSGATYVYSNAADSSWKYCALTSIIGDDVGQEAGNAGWSQGCEISQQPNGAWTMRVTTGNSGAAMRCQMFCMKVG